MQQHGKLDLVTLGEDRGGTEMGGEVKTARCHHSKGRVYEILFITIFRV